MTDRTAAGELQHPQRLPLTPLARTGQVRMAGITIVRIADGKIVERWAVTDQLGLLQQFDALPQGLR